MRYRLQNRIAQSSLTLPTACVVATLLWWLPQGGYSTDYLLGWLICALAVYFVIETTAINQLLRIRSRMISSLVLLLMAACGFLHPLQTGTVIFLCMTVSFYCLFRTYDHPRPEVNTFHAYLMISLGSLLWPPLLLLVLMQFWNQVVFLRSMSGKSLGATLIGFLLPYFFWAGGAFVLGQMQPFVNHAEAIIAPVSEPVRNALDGGALFPKTYMEWLGFEGQDEQNNTETAQNCWQATASAAQHTDWNGFCANFICWLNTRWPQMAALVFVLLLGLTGFIHYVCKSYDDKISVRMCHYCFMAMQVVVILWMALQPQHFRLLFPLLILTTAPAAAHFIALTRTWWTNAWFILLTIGLLAVGVCCLSESLLDTIKP